MYIRFIPRSTWIIDLERPDRNLLGAMETACWRRTWFSDSKLLIFSSSLINGIWNFGYAPHQIKGRDEWYDIIF
jgi:hypothetical protein